MQVMTTCGVSNPVDAVGPLVDGSCSVAVFGTLGHVVAMEAFVTPTQRSQAYVLCVYTGPPWCSERLSWVGVEIG